mgnify:CR=1 FL=1
MCDRSFAKSEAFAKVPKKLLIKCVSASMIYHGLFCAHRSAQMGFIMKKVTLQEIASSLGISRTTVWKVFSGHEGVSDNLREKVLTRARELNYTFPEELAVPHLTDAGSAPANIALAVSRPETSIFWMNIIHQIAKELSAHNVNLVYTYLPSTIEEDYVLPATLTNGSTHGIIILNIYNERMLRLLSAVSVPKVFLDTATSVPPAELNGDLILMESSISISEITEHLIAQGRKTFGFIGDINYAHSNYERFEGFSRTLERNGLKLSQDLMLTGPIGMNTYKEEIDAFLDTLPSMPEAFVCVSDYVACLLIQLLQKRGLRVPGDVAVSGFDGNMESPLAEGLTTVQVFNEDIGMRLAEQILYRIKHPDSRYEITYISSQVILRASTGRRIVH